ncbi:hypothetical protein CG723_44095 [Streptomyces sp. CB01635]|nr:hypothetical protein CG723_44095 [Streptomyces sp. CB01635]
MFHEVTEGCWKMEGLAAEFEVNSCCGAEDLVDLELHDRGGGLSKDRHQETSDSDFQGDGGVGQESLGDLNALLVVQWRCGVAPHWCGDLKSVSVMVSHCPFHERAGVLTDAGASKSHSSMCP